MNPFLGVAIFVLLWWLTFFTLLPIGARSPHESDEDVVAGADRGAPKSHRLALKAAWAAAIAAVLWLGVAWAISVDLLNVRP